MLKGCQCLELLDKIALQVVIDEHLTNVQGNIDSLQKLIDDYPLLIKHTQWESSMQMKRSEFGGYMRLLEVIKNTPNCN